MFYIDELKMTHEPLVTLAGFFLDMKAFIEGSFSNYSAAEHARFQLHVIVFDSELQ